MIQYICPVCAYAMSEPIEEGNICSCCGTEFGYDNDLGVTYRQLRERWINQGMLWFSPVVERPAFWNPVRQLVQADYDFDMPEGAVATTTTTAYYSASWIALGDQAA